MDVVYHYCSMESFISIISNSTLRATNIRKSNDNKEIIRCIDSFQSAVKSALNKYYKENPDDSAFKDFMRITHEDKIGMLDTDSIIANEINNETCTYYVVCFSEAFDLLSQWRGYADDGRGVAIGFDENILKNESKYGKLKYAQISYDLGNVYLDTQQSMLGLLEKVKKEKKDCITELDYHKVFFELLNKMVYNAAYYKDPAFSEEKERRLVYFPFGTIINLLYYDKVKELTSHSSYYDRMTEVIEMEEDIGLFKRNKMEFWVKNDQLTSYVDLSFEKLKPYCIAEIVLGPKCPMDDLDLRLFLIKHGIDISYTRIIKSKASYR